MSQTWRKYGGTNHYDNANNVSIDNLMVKNFTITDKLTGKLTIDGTLFVRDSATFMSDVFMDTNLNVSGNVTMKQNLDLCGNVAMYGKTVMNGPLDVNGTLSIQNDLYIRVGGSFTVDKNKITMGNSTPRGNVVLITDLFSSTHNLGINIVNTFDSSENVTKSTLATFQINTVDLSNQHSLNITSASDINENIVAKNSGNRGISTYADNSQCSIRMYDSDIPDFMPNSNNVKVPSAAFSYTYIDQTLNIDASNLFVPGKLAMGSNSYIRNERVVIHDIPSGPYLFDTFEQLDFTTGNALTLVTDNSASNTFLNIITPPQPDGTVCGAGFHGGSYNYDPLRSASSYGVFTANNLFVPNQTVVSSTNAGYRRSTLGINQTQPTTETYVLDINGTVKISQSEINVVRTTAFALSKVVLSKQSPGTGIAFGYSYNDLYASVLVTRDTGNHWNALPDLDLSGNTSNNLVHGFMYNESNILVSNGSQFYFYNGNSWSYNLEIKGGVGVGTIGAFMYVDFQNTNSSTLRDDDGPHVLFYSDAGANRNLFFSKMDGNYNLNVNTTIVSNIPIYAMDSYDASYVFVAGKGIQKYDITTTLEEGTSIPSLTLKDLSGAINQVYNSTKTYYAVKTYKTYDASSGRLQNDTGFSIFVGDGIISVTYDARTLFDRIIYTTDDDQNRRNVVFSSVDIFDLSRAIAVGDGGSVYYTSDSGNSWSRDFSTVFPSAYKLRKQIFDPNYPLMSVSIIDRNSFIITRLDAPVSLESFGKSKIFYAYLPELFNHAGNHVLDVIGSMSVVGSASIADNLTVNTDAVVQGQLTVNRGNVLIHPNGGESFEPSSGVLVVDGGVGVNGNVSLSGTLNANTIYSSEDVMDIRAKDVLILRSKSLLLGINSWETEEIILGNDDAKITIYGDVTQTKPIVSTSSTMILNNGNLSVNPPTGVGIIIDCPNGAFGGGFVKTNAVTDPASMLNTSTGFLFKTPFSRNVVDLDVTDLRLDSRIPPLNPRNPSLNLPTGHGLVVLQPSLLPDASYSITTTNPYIDVSNVVLTNAINAINGVQTIHTDMSFNGNLYIANREGAVPSISTSSGALVVRGGAGFSGNLYLGNGTVSTSTGTGTLVVTGGAGFSGNVYLGNGTVSTSTGSGTLVVQGGAGFSGNVYLGNDTSSNSPTSGTLVVKGGAGISGNLFLGGDASSNSTGTGTLVVTGGAGFSGNVYLGNGTVSTSSGTGTLVVTGGAGFSGNVYLGNGTVSTSTGSGTLVVSGGAGLSGNLYLGGGSTSTSSGTGTLVVTGGAGFSGNVYLGNDTSSNSTGSGTLVVKGGVGISGNVYLGNGTVSTSTGTGTLVVAGGAGFSGNLYLGGDASSNSPTSGTLVVTGGAGFSGKVYLGDGTKSTSTGTGSLVVLGGAGFSGSVSIGEDITINGSIILNGQASGSICDSRSDQILGGIKSFTSELLAGPFSSFSTGLLAYFPFDTSMSEYSSGSPVNFANTSASNPPVISSTVKQVGLGSLYMNSPIGSTGSYLEIADPAINESFRRLTNYTISFWVDLSNVPLGATYDNTQFIKFFDISGIYAGVSLYKPTGGVSSRKLRIGSNTVSDYDLSYNRWYNIVITHTVPLFSQITQTLPDPYFSYYVNYGASDSRDSSFAYPGDGTKMRLGLSDDIRTANKIQVGNSSIIAGTGGGNVQYYVDDFRIYSRVLSQVDISMLYMSTGRSFINAYDTPNTLTPDASLSVIGGLGVTGNTYISGLLNTYNLKVYSPDTPNNVSTSTSTGALLVTGGVGIGGNLWAGEDIHARAFYSLSDYRIKGNVTNLGGGSLPCTVDVLRPVRYDNLMTRREDIGFLAHEVQEHYPFLVSGDKDGSEHQSINYTGMIGMLTHEIQQLKRRVAHLEEGLGI